ncbi:hypothetical protein T484DRAFT_1760128 [Baffinella frigidus]|nr:hypothetical protein T484DRAFT_1760128 [Cryptophyta sp. CCMP2293]
MSGVAANANVRTWRAGEDECEGLQEGDVVGKFGEKFIWERGHRTAAQLAPLRRLGDLRADALLDRVSAKQGLGAANDAFEEDIFELIQSGGAAASDPMAKDFLAHYSTPPSWLDESKLQRGQGVFVRYLPAAGATLYYVSLVGGFSAPLVTKRAD